MPKNASKLQAASSADWRIALREYASGLAAAARASGGSALPIDAWRARFPEQVTAALGDQAALVQAIVEQLALGAAADARKPALAEEALDAQLALVVEGISPRLRRSVPANNPQPEGRPRFFQSELWQLLYEVRESSELSYAREVDLPELDRRVLLLLRRAGAKVPADISAATGVDKAQVSRSIKRLLDLELVDRKQIRNPLALTESGGALADRLLRVAELRNRELTFDVDDEELAEFVAALEQLLDRAVQIYDRERELSGARLPDSNPSAYSDAEERRAGEKITVNRSRVVAPLLTLSSYYSRSGALSCKRLTGLSNFESWVLTEISFDPPTKWTDLVGALQRDHSQAGRTVNALLEKGLIEREGRPARRHGTFWPTEEGTKVYRVLFEAALKRAEFLLAPLSPDRRERFMATFGKIRRNASAQLDRERALDELRAD